MTPAVGSPAPAFSAPDQHGKMHSLSDYKRRWLLLYFYPKDDTSGCTAEACGIRDAYAQYKKKGIEVLGVSPDDVVSHNSFAKKYELPFSLLADSEKEIIKRYKVWREKSMYGKKYMGVVRSSFLIDPNGVIAKIYESVSPEHHAQEVLEDQEQLL